MEPVQTSGGPDHLAFKPHPLLPLPAAEELARDMADPVRREAALAFLSERAKLLRLDELDPLWHKLRLVQSRELDRLLCQYQMVYESGGKRAGKTEDGVPRFLRSCFKYGKAKRWAMQDNALSSVANLQQLFWKYLPESVKKLNGARNKKQRQQYRVHYSPDGGFDGLLILPNGCEIYFLNYTQQPNDFLGWELGKDTALAMDPNIPDIGALLDENCPLTWLENIQMRCSTRGAKIHWMYSPQDGITPAIRDLKSNAVTVQSLPAELLAGTVNVPGLPRGHMPYVQVDEKKRLAIFYRYTEWNPFSGYDRPGGVRELCQGKANKDYTMRHAYGYCEAVRGRACPKFSVEVNVVKPSEVPALGTNYTVTDPHGAKNWFTVWARACPGRPGDVFIYREWPDYETFGDWAVTSANPKKLNGDRGPAQPTIGFGPAQYKNLFLRLEKIMVPSGLKAEKSEARSQEPAWTDARWDLELKSVPDAAHRLAIRRAVANEEDLDNLTETIFERLIDPRAARNQNATERGGIDLLTKLAQPSTKAVDGADAAPMYFTPAPGLDLREGISQLNELLYYDETQERVSLLNAPRLYVSSACRNVIWALQNYCLPTDELTSDDACEEPMDCLRYLVTRGVRYIEPGGRVKTTGGGAY